MAATYRLRVTLQRCDLILEYRDLREQRWSLAGLHSFEQDSEATSAFRSLQKYTESPSVIRDKFRTWGCEIPAELEGVVMPVMTAGNFKLA